MCLRTALSLAACTILAAEEPVVYQPDAADAALVGFFTGLYERTPPFCQERFAVNRIPERGWHQDAFSSIDGRRASTAAERAAARIELGALRDQIALGQGWPQPPAIDIPRCAAPPVIDGDDADRMWAGALEFRGELPMNVRQAPGGAAVWRLAWDEANLYAMGHFPDAKLVINRANNERKPQPWDGDCFEVFVLPEPRLRTYWEVVVNPRGDVFDGLQCNNTAGGIIAHPEEDMRGLNAAARALPDDSGWCVEVALPFAELPGYMRGNIPRAGETLSLMLVRTDDNARRVPVPFLYDGHNIFGYMRATLR